MGNGNVGENEVVASIEDSVDQSEIIEDIIEIEDVIAKLELRQWSYDAWKRVPYFDVFCVRIVESKNLYGLLVIKLRKNGRSWQKRKCCFIKTMHQFAHLLSR